MARRRRPRPSSTATPPDPSLPSPTPPGVRKRVAGAAWRMFPFRGRYLSASTRYVFERLPEGPVSFSASDVAVLCVEADQALDVDVPCNPAEIIDLLTSRGLVSWTDAGFVKKGRRPPRRPRA